MNSTKAKTSYNPCKIRRRVRHQMITSEGVAVGVTKSFSRDDGTVYHPIIDLHCGRVNCQCAHFEYRLARHHPTLRTPQYWCKHIRREVGNLVRRGLLTIQDEQDQMPTIIENAVAPLRHEVQALVDPITGEVLPNYLPDGEFDYSTYFD